MIIVEKPVNIPTQGDESGDIDMLSLIKEYIKEKYNKPGNVFLGLVHRLDRPVGGVMVFAKTSKAASRLSEQVRSRNLKKTYLAVVHGNIINPNGTLIDYLIKDNKTNTVKIVKKDINGAKEAVLDYNLIDTKDGLSLIKVNLQTGRPHQIRVQFAGLGNPLWGDQKYGAKISKFGQQIALWSHEIKLTHPVSKEEMSFKSVLPDKYPWSLFDFRM
ncbi:MAG: RluA family pseudouridine synthase [Ignavibacteriales bacterium]